MNKLFKNYRTIFLGLFALAILLFGYSNTFAANTTNINDFIVADNGSAQNADDAESEDEEDEEEEEEEDEEEELTPEELAAIRAEKKAHEVEIAKLTNQLENEVIKAGNNHKKIKGLFNSDKSLEALCKSTILLEAYLGSLLSEEKPNYTDLTRYANELSRQKPDSSLAAYAQGIAAMHAKRPNYNRALKYLTKAKNAKKPHEGASSAYYICLIKCYLKIALLILAIIVLAICVVIIKKKKDQKKKEATSEWDEKVQEDIDGNALQAMLDTDLISKQKNNDLDFLNLNLGSFSNNQAQDLNTSKKKDDISEGSTTETPNNTVNENVLTQNIAPTLETPSNQNVSPTIENISNQSVTPTIENVSDQSAAPAIENISNQSVPPIIENISNQSVSPTIENVSNQSVATTIENISSQNISPNQENISAQSAATIQENTSTSAPTKKIVRVVKKVRVRKDANGNTYVIPDNNPPTVSSYETTVQEEPRIEEVRNITKPNSRPVPPIDSELDALWGDLSRKALQSRIAPLTRKQENLSDSRIIQNNTISEETNNYDYGSPINKTIDYSHNSATNETNIYGNGYAADKTTDYSHNSATNETNIYGNGYTADKTRDYNHNPATNETNLYDNNSTTNETDNYGYDSSSAIEEQEKDFGFSDVSIDLSEEALKDDLIGKLKMFAITDSELRQLFAMKNPAHIPYLIEYVMTKPEPMRLAFVAKELGNYKDPAIIDTLSSLLYHEDERVVLASIQGLEATKSIEAVIPLCPFLRSEVPLFAQAARTALSKFGAARIMQALKDLPSFTDIKLKEAGVFVLSRMKGEPVERILKELLHDETSSVRIQVILAMSYQKNPVYTNALREFYHTASEKEKSMARKAIVYLNSFNK